VKGHHGVNAYLGCDASQVAAKEDEAKRNPLPLGLQPGMAKTQKDRKSDNCDRRDAQMKARFNVEGAEDQNGLKRKNRG
jgi:hypothetical protein